jgi:hypothetical protein
MHSNVSLSSIAIISGKGSGVACRNRGVESAFSNIQAPYIYLLVACSSMADSKDQDTQQL